MYRKEKTKGGERTPPYLSPLVPPVTAQYHQKESKAHLPAVSKRREKKTKLARLSLDEHLQNNYRITCISTSGHSNPASSSLTTQPHHQATTMAAPFSLQPHQSIKPVNKRLVKNEKKVVSMSLRPP